ncbi:hypothetical protein [Acidovorax sp. SUPP3334]|uniref:hypothetical protein n=1 Tax=Acidovorax sp. SUPP3334 TaxID=2920881 RepID=UPI0023DE1CD5|nr:hypothetical protein [Acidovorax sp. SUPP3334]GKT21315.1 hypothetical protein AVHM3334_04360 [Acidovorax sp. SUPP3334]
MTGLKGADALLLHKKLKERNAVLRNAELDAAKELADKNGKERFDLEKLEILCDTSQAGRLAGVKERQATYEYMYYVEYKNVCTLQEFARVVTTLASWS